MKITITIDTGDSQGNEDHYIKALAHSLKESTSKLEKAMVSNTTKHSTSRTLFGETHMANPVIQKLIDQVNKTQGVIASATTFITGFKQRLDDAVAAAIANGATEEELAPIQTEIDELDAQTTALSEALANNP